MPQDKPRTKLSFDEDNFDLDSHAKKTHMLSRKKNKEKHARQIISIAKVAMAVAAGAISIILYHLITVFVF